MPIVTFIDPEGGRHEVDAAMGRSLMRAARDAGVPGVIAECGGCMTCGTCHVHVTGGHRTMTPSPEESELLNMLADFDETSRLSCQLRMSELLAGIVLRVADPQG